MTIHLPAETALALAMALTDVRIDLHAKRTAAEQAIEDLIQFLDDTEGDPDYEALGDELDCSWPEGRRPFGALCEDDEDVGDHEPSLGSPEARSLPVDYFRAGRSLIIQTGPMGSQVDWAAGCSSDGEDNVEDEGEAVNEDGGNVTDEPHDAMDEGNDEISLGWSLDMDQRKACAQAALYGDEESWGAA